MPIPKSKTTPTEDLGRKLILLHAPPKFGKSAIASEFPSAIFLATEPGLNSLSVMRWEDEQGNYVIDSWDKLMQATKEVVQSEKFATLIIDTLDLAVELCTDHICAKHDEEDLNDGKLGYGKGRRKVNNEFRRYLTKLGNLNMGVVLLSHTVDEEIETRTGKITRAVPNVHEKTRKSLLGAMDIILYGDFENKGRADVARVLRTKPHPSYEAGDRTKRLPETVPMSYAAISDAFSTGVGGK